jgi:hypothetical protein
MNPFIRLLHRKPKPEKQVTMVEAIRALHALAPAHWIGDVERAAGYASRRDWERVLDRLQAAALANRGTPFGDESERLRARAEELAAANWRPPPTPLPARPSLW